MTKKQFSNIVKKRRAIYGMSQEQFAKKMNVHWMTILRWENAKTMPKKDALKYWLERLNK